MRAVLEQVAVRELYWAPIMHRHNARLECAPEGAVRQFFIGIFCLEIQRGLGWHRLTRLLNDLCPLLFLNQFPARPHDLVWQTTDYDASPDYS